MDKFLAIGHRGAKGYVMENTIRSIEYALKSGVNAIEIDVYRCASGEMVVFHDETLTRLSARIDRIEDLTLEEIQLILLYGGYSIPTLEDVIAFVDNRVVLNVELKGQNTALGTFDCISKCIENGNVVKDNILISSFHDEELRMYKKLDTAIKIGVLTRGDIEGDIALAKELFAFSIHPFFEQVDKDLIIRLHKMNFKIIPFTVNETDRIQQLIIDGVDGIFCDYPDRLVKCLNQ